jgi:hypothetical protein
VLQHLPCAYDDTIEGQWSIRENIIPNTGGPKKTPCGDYELKIDSSHIFPMSFDRPCTGNANTGSWLAIPFQERVEIIPCGTEWSGRDGSHGTYNTCPENQVISGKFDVEEEFGREFPPVDGPDNPEERTEGHGRSEASFEPEPEVKQQQNSARANGRKATSRGGGAAGAGQSASKESKGISRGIVASGSEQGNILGAVIVLAMMLL